MVRIYKFFLSSIILFVCLNTRQAEGNPKRGTYQFFVETDAAKQAKSANESWGYVTVRLNAHMFYWVYHTTHSAGYQNRPLILWLQGGPGGSGCGFGNFGEIGPLDVSQQPRKTTWLQTASLLFVDNPVGTGFSYVDDDSAFTTNLQEISNDLLTLIKAFLQSHPDFKKTPFYIFSESYGGKMTAGFSDVLYKAIVKGELELNFQGLALGDSWISPLAYTNSWGPYLYATSIVSNTGLIALSKEAKKVADLVNKGDFAGATEAWSDLEDMVEVEGSGVNFYNILDWQGGEVGTVKHNRNHLEKLYERHVRQPMMNDALTDLMNGPIRKKLKIIPENVTWGGQSGDVFKYQAGDFMKNVTSIVNDLVNTKKLQVVVYNGQLDLICDTLGTEYWFFNSLDIAQKFKKAERHSYKCDTKDSACFFGQTLDNVRFYWILKAGHMVPQDNGPAALAMVEQILGKL